MCESCEKCGSPIEDKVCSGCGRPAAEGRVRVTWENKKRHIFDEVHKYKLVWTKVESGRSLTFIPEGIISQKGGPVGL